jgi:hypothetical protein
MDGMKVKAPTVRHVLGKLSKSQLEKIKIYAKTNKFSHSWYWHGPEGSAGMDFRGRRLRASSALADCACALAVAFNVDRSTQAGNFWGAEVNGKLTKAMGHLSESSGGDVGTVNYILELSKISHDDLVSIVDDSLSGDRNLDDIPLATSVHEAVLERKPPRLRSMEQAPMLKKVLSALPNKQLGAILRYSNESSFHHGWYWFGPEGAVGITSKEERFAKKGPGDPIAIAFGLTPSRSPTSWRGCELNDNFRRALKFWATHSGSEAGMEDYVTDLNALSSDELNRLVRTVAAEALSA